MRSTRVVWELVHVRLAETAPSRPNRAAPSHLPFGNGTLALAIIRVLRVTKTKLPRASSHGSSRWGIYDVSYFVNTTSHWGGAPQSGGKGTDHVRNAFVSLEHLPDFGWLALAERGECVPDRTRPSTRSQTRREKAASVVDAAQLLDRRRQ